MGDPHVVAVIGGACAGSTAAEILAEAGARVVVFEQNPRPYGKIEDGLPRWHLALRKKEYCLIDGRIDRPEVEFVPNTKLGRDVDLETLAREWGFSAVVLANGAWRDRPLPVEGIDEYIDKGLIYQNPFIYWFNHKNEAAYAGPTYEVHDRTIVLGGGLASIDVVKAVQLELYERALKERGVECTMVELEHKGITAFCEARDIDPASLGVEGCTLYYRRRKIDMPLAEPKRTTPEGIAKAQEVRARILDLAMGKFRFHFVERHLPVDKIVEGDRLAGLVFQETAVEDGRAVPIPGSEKEVRAPLVISSIGSIPEPLPGIEMKGTFYRFADWDLGVYEPMDNVFATGNVITGKGNIRASVLHAREVAKHVAEHLAQQPPPANGHLDTVLERVRQRQREVGYDGSYREWIERVTPPDME